MKLRLSCDLHSECGKPMGSIYIYSPDIKQSDWSIQTTWYKECCTLSFQTSFILHHITVSQVGCYGYMHADAMTECVLITVFLLYY